jgi:hypothetical protein
MSASDELPHVRLTAKHTFPFLKETTKKIIKMIDKTYFCSPLLLKCNKMKNNVKRSFDDIQTYTKAMLE